MLTWEEIEQLEAFDGRGARVLTAYLDLDPARQIQRPYRIVFEDLVKEARDRLEEPTRADMLREAERVQTWLGSLEPRGKGLALFSCAPLGFWQAHFLPVRIKDHLAFEPKPDLAPLLELLDEYERYTVALVNKESARLLTVFAGEIEEAEAFADDVPGKHDQGALSQARYQRHHEAHVHWHLKRVAEHLAELLRRRRFDRLILAGPEEATSELRRLLPHALAQRLVAVIPAELSANAREILEKTLEIERRVERDVEEDVLEEVIEKALGGGRATFGVAPTLEALWAGDVQTLVVADGVHLDGTECPNCGRLEPGSVPTCPACGAAVRPVHDLVHRVMERALEQGGRVEVVHGDAARRLEDMGGLGALLRYRWLVTPAGAGDRSG